MDTTCSRNGQMSTQERYYEISTTMREEPRTPTEEASGLLYWDRSGPQGLGPWDHDDDDDDDSDDIGLPNKLANYTQNSIVRAQSSV
jgi:hypothetical protein